MATLIFTAIVLVGAGAWVLGHLYLYRRLARDTTRRPWLRRLAAAALAGLALLTLVAMVLPRLSGRVDGGWVVFGGLLWMGAAFYLVLALGLIDAGRGLFALGRRLRNGRPFRRSELSGPADPGRRAFLSRALTGAAVFGAGGMSALAVRSARWQIETPEVVVRLARLPAALEGYRIALLSDLHLGPTLGVDFCRRVVAQTNALRPDAVAITGDLVDGPVRLLAPALAPLADLRPRQGVYFTTGNHEYYVDPHGWLAHLPRLGIRVLANQRVVLGDRDARGARFVLAGIHDRRAAWFDPAHAPDPAAALAGRDPEQAVVLLAHQPAQLEQVTGLGVDLQLSGHTHGGQLFPFGALTMLAQPYLAGLHRHDATTQIYVSRGTGYWGPPMRMWAPAEIGQIVLTG